MFWSLHDKSEQPIETIVPAFLLWSCSQPIGHPEWGKSCFVLPWTPVRENVMVQVCLREQRIHRSLHWYSLSRKSGNYYGYKGNRATFSPWQSFISYRYLLTNVMRVGVEGGWHPSAPLPSLAQLEGSDWIAAYSMSGLWCSPAKCWFWWKYCDMVQLQELKLHSLIPSSSTNFFLALASLLLYSFLN